MQMLEQLEQKKIAITGASGYIGTPLLALFKGHAIDVIGVSRQPGRDDGSANHLQADITDLECWLELVAEADVIFHLAGNTSVLVADSDPGLDLTTTTHPIVHLIQAAKTLGRKPRVVFSSTATVYGLTSAEPTSESVTPRPITFYDLHKRFVEEQLRFATSLGVLEGVSLRLTNVYGPSSGHPSSDKRGVLNKVTALAISGRALSVYGGGQYTRDYIFLDDVLDALVRAGSRPGAIGQELNIGSGRAVSVRDAFITVAAEVEQQTNMKVDIKSVPWPPCSHEIEKRHFVASIQRASSVLGWKPSTRFAEGISELVSATLAGLANDRSRPSAP